MCYAITAITSARTHKSAHSSHLVALHAHARARTHLEHTQTGYSAAGIYVVKTATMSYPRYISLYQSCPLIAMHIAFQFYLVNVYIPDPLLTPLREPGTPAATPQVGGCLPTCKTFQKNWPLFRVLPSGVRKVSVKSAVLPPARSPRRPREVRRGHDWGESFTSAATQLGARRRHETRYSIYVHV